jgi:hypothetical protein
MEHNIHASRNLGSEKIDTISLSPLFGAFSLNWEEYHGQESKTARVDRRETSEI